MWWSSSSGKVELNITLSDAKLCSHMGHCDSDVTYMLGLPKYAKQMSALSKDGIVEELREYGAWSTKDLSDVLQNERRIFWIACCDLAERDDEAPSRRTYYLWRYGGVTQRKHYKNCQGDSIIAVVRAENHNDARWCFQNRAPGVRRRKA